MVLKLAKPTDLECMHERTHTQIYIDTQMFIQIISHILSIIPLTMNQLCTRTHTDIEI